MIIVPLSPILITIAYIGIAIYYNNFYIKDLVNKGYMPCSNKDTLLLEKVLNSNLAIEEVVVKLIKKANLRGGNDNISIAYLKKESGDQ